jgi:hypothetical protein
MQREQLKIIRGVPALITLSVSGTREISLGQISWHLPHRVHRERNSSSDTAPGGRRNFCFGSKNRIRPPRGITTAPFPTSPTNARRVRSEPNLSRLPIPFAILPTVCPASGSGLRITVTPGSGLLYTKVRYPTNSPTAMLQLATSAPCGGMILSSYCLTVLGSISLNTSTLVQRFSFSAP